MSPARLLLVCAALSLPVCSGCALVQPVKDVTRGVVRSMKPNPSDYDNQSTFEDTEWDFVGEEARGDKVREKEYDPFWHFYHPTTRSINRNLGYEG